MIISLIVAILAENIMCITIFSFYHYGDEDNNSKHNIDYHRHNFVRNGAQGGNITEC